VPLTCGAGALHPCRRIPDTVDLPPTNRCVDLPLSGCFRGLHRPVEPAVDCGRRQLAAIFGNSPAEILTSGMAGLKGTPDEGGLRKRNEESPKVDMQSSGPPRGTEARANGRCPTNRTSAFDPKGKLANVRYREFQSTLVLSHCGRLCTHLCKRLRRCSSRPTNGGPANLEYPLRDDVMWWHPD